MSLTVYRRYVFHSLTEGGTVVGHGHVFYPCLKKKKKKCKDYTRAHYTPVYMDRVLGGIYTLRPPPPSYFSILHTSIHTIFLSTHTIPLIPLLYPSVHCFNKVQSLLIFFFVLPWFNHILLSLSLNFALWTVAIHRVMHRETLGFLFDWAWAMFCM